MLKRCFHSTVLRLGRHTGSMALEPAPRAFSKKQKKRKIRKIALKAGVKDQRKEKIKANFLRDRLANPELVELAAQQKMDLKGAFSDLMLPDGTDRLDINEPIYRQIRRPQVDPLLVLYSLMNHKAKQDLVLTGKYPDEFIFITEEMGTPQIPSSSSLSSSSTSSTIADSTTTSTTDSATSSLAESIYSNTSTTTTDLSQSEQDKQSVLKFLETSNTSDVIENTDSISYDTSLSTDSISHRVVQNAILPDKESIQSALKMLAARYDFDKVNEVCFYPLLIYIYMFTTYVHYISVPFDV